MVQQASIMREYMKTILKESLPTEKVREVLDHFFDYEERFEITPNGRVNILGPITVIAHRKFDRLPVNFGIIKGDFYCAFSELKTLEGAPTEVTGSFVVSGNNLKSLKHGPTSVCDYYCDDNILTSLEGSPKYAEFFTCRNNNLTSVIGGPENVKDEFVCNDNPLTTYEGMPTSTDGWLIVPWISNIPLLRLVGKKVHFYYGVEIIPDRDKNYPSYILKKYIGTDNLRAKIIACQKELIDAGFEGNASW